MELLQHLKQCGWLRLLLLTREQPALLKPLFTIDRILIYDRHVYNNYFISTNVKKSVTSATGPTDLRSLVHLEPSLGSLLFQLLLQPPTLCPPLAQSLLSSGLQLIPGLVALLEQCLFLLPLNLLFALEEMQPLNLTTAWLVKVWPVGLQHRPLTLPAFAAPAPSTPGPRTIAGEQNAKS